MIGMNTAWDFVKRHRNKIAAAATFVGAVYATKKVLDQQGYHVSDLFGSFSSATNRGNPMIQSKKNFIFDSYQQSCDKQVRDVIQDLIEHLNNRFDIDELVKRLQRDESIDTKEKVDIWNMIKHRTFSKIIAIAYMHSLVLLALKLQKSILCRETIKNFETTSQKNVGITDYVHSFFSQPASAADPRMVTDSKAQQVFLNCIQYLTTYGINTLYDQIEACTTETLSNVGLAKEFNVSGLKELLEKLKFRVEHTIGQSGFSELVVPPISMSESDLTNLRYSPGHLEELLSKLSSSLQSSRSHVVLSSFVQRYVNETVDFVENELETIKPVAVAKLLPILGGSFSKISSTSYDSVLQQNIASPEIYQLSQMAFSS